MGLISVTFNIKWPEEHFRKFFFHQKVCSEAPFSGYKIEFFLIRRIQEQNKILFSPKCEQLYLVKKIHTDRNRMILPFE